MSVPLYQKLNARSIHLTDELFDIEYTGDKPARTEHEHGTFNHHHWLRAELQDTRAKRTTIMNTITDTDTDRDTDTYGHTNTDA